MTKRMKLKLLRKWFVQSLAKPIRLSAQHFAELLEVLFQENTTELLGYAYRNGIDVSIFFEGQGKTG